MTEDVKKRLYELAGYEIRVLKEDAIKYKTYFELDLLIHAMWAINDEFVYDNGIWEFDLFPNKYGVYKEGKLEKYFRFKKGSESKIKALQAALEYIFEQDKENA